MVRTRHTAGQIAIPDGVSVTVKGRVIRVYGPRGKLTRKFNQSIDITRGTIDGDKPALNLEIWFGRKKDLSSVKTLSSHINNMFIGVTKGFLYKMRYVYAHFPITGVINKDGHQLEIRNFLGEKRRRTVNLVGDTQVLKSPDVKDQIESFGNSVEDVGRSCALINQACLVKKKDIRKFLDGTYISEKGNIVCEE